jgi:hypothetical protein
MLEFVYSCIVIFMGAGIVRRSRGEFDTAFVAGAVDGLRGADYSAVSFGERF